MKLGIQDSKCHPRSQFIVAFICLPLVFSVAVSIDSNVRQDGGRRIKRTVAVPSAGVPRISTQELEEMVEKATVIVEKRLNTIEKDIYESGVVLDPGSPAWFAAVSAKTKVVAKNVSKMALIAEEATRLIAKKHGLNSRQVAHGLPAVDVRGTGLERECPLSLGPPCRAARYRAYGGRCNNPQHPSWGTANAAYVRFLAPRYADGVSTPRQSVLGGPLVSSLVVSRAVHSDLERPHPHLTVFFAVFAAFVFHDIAHTSQAAGYKGQRLRCCGVPPSLLHPECLPITDDTNRCSNYVRSCSVPRAGCTLGPREQINQVTSFLDASVLYGASEEEVRRLREGRSGLMRTQPGEQLLPADLANPFDCRSNASVRPCFVAGDIRVNENIGLMAMHTLWVRQHNKIAKGLAAVNPQWNDDQLFEETRRIIVAQLQHVTYSELLPTLLGPQVAMQFDLQPLQGGDYYRGYDIELHPGTSNVFAAVVAPATASTMPPRFRLQAGASLQRPLGSVAMRGFDPGVLYGAGAVGKVALGMAGSQAQAMDEHISVETNNVVHDERDTRNGGVTDVAAWAIQQGRDHGIAGYVEWRRVCRLEPDIRNFTTLLDVMNDEAAKKIIAVYRDVRDIDLFTGGLSEKPLVGGALGPTFACILSRQFRHLRRGDRYWYENDMPPSAFEPDQLQEIRRTTLTRIVCDNAGEVVRMLQPSLMIMPDDFLNALQDCESAAPAMDLTQWKTSKGESPAFEIPKETLLTSLREAMRQAKKRIAAEQQIFSNNVGVADARSAQAVHHVFLRPKRQASLLSNASLVLELASQRYLQDIHLKDPERKPSHEEVSAMMLALSAQDVEDFLLNREEDEDPPEGREGRCDLEEGIADLPCDPTTPFRSASGRCNNLKHPHWGKAVVTFQRLLPPSYHDGVSAPRGLGMSGGPLPSPRLVSSTVHRDVEAPHARYTLALMQWGQFLDHDLTLTPMHEAQGRRPLDCKPCDSQTTVHPECMPIVVPAGDPFFPAKHANASRNCIAFARSLAGQLTLGRREQLNQVTSYLDASNVYGSDECEARMLRTFRGGRLNSTKSPSGGKDLLPQDNTNVECRAPSGICFESGDIRASEQPGLTSMHTVWMRQHNRLADDLSTLNPHWSDDVIFQHARRIVSAMMQHITFTEFLPRVLGETEMKRMAPPKQTYDPDCDATVYNEFAAAAYRFGHTLLKPLLPRLGPGYVKSGGIRLRTAFFNPDVLYEAGAVDEVLRGLLSGSAEAFDAAITSEVTNHLFEDRATAFSGMDLIALNLQRGRDHGLPPYNAYRGVCNRTRAEKFEDLNVDVPAHVVERLRAVYGHVNDVDLFSGGVSERPRHGALVGPTFGCVIARQFEKLRRCDRFWYETNDPFIRFTPDQLSEIRKTRLSKVICDNSNNIETVQMSAFDIPENFLNPRMPCKSIPALDLRPWSDAKICTTKSERSQPVEIAVGQSTRISPCTTCACTKEGMICQSTKIANCFRLATEFSRQAILADDVCKVQCAFAFRAYPQFEANLDNVLGFSIDE